MSAYLMSVILGAPLIGSLLCGLVLRGKNVRLVGTIASAAVGVAFISTGILFSQYVSTGDPITTHYFNWIVIGQLEIGFDFTADALSLLMGLIVTGIGGLIHVYAIGYMHDDATPSRFFAYLNLFIVAMLILVFGSNLPLMFIGWEGVGLCSYLLIGYWYKHMENAVFGMKAFVVNRIGDLGFLLGIFGCFFVFGSLNFSDITQTIMEGGYVSSFTLDMVNIVALCLFVGAVGKSAQIPLYVWLPDAMAGPTPVSALIHAATMVTSGLVLLTRMHALFGIAGLASQVVLWVGVLTAVFAAIIGLAQHDIKKVLAYSTVSQLGYMFAAMGVGAYGVGMFHVFTHACFKALLFMGAGSVIVGMHHEQDMRNMGGLRHKMPITFWTMLIATFAIAGIFPLSGFFSKDEILFSVFTHHHGLNVPYLLLLFGAGLTAFYMMRLMIMTFWGDSKLPQEKFEHVKESPFVITVPLIILAVLSAGVGFLGLPHFLGSNIFAHYLEAGGISLAHHDSSDALAIGLAVLSLFVAGSGLGLGWLFYVKQPTWPALFVGRIQGVYRLVLNKFKVDEYYDLIFIRPLVLSSLWVWKWVDAFLIDGIVNHVGRLTRLTGNVLGLFQTGNVQTYALFMVIGAVILFLFFARGYWY
jgi:NADH-quinone oxidoreductase subunit L